MLLGYARVSTDDQDLALQRQALRDAGCHKTFEEKISGARPDRPELARLLDQVRQGDVLVVTRLDRLARSTAHLLDVAERLRAADAGLRSGGGWSRRSASRCARPRSCWAATTPRSTGR